MRLRPSGSRHSLAPLGSKYLRLSPRILRGLRPPNSSPQSVCICTLVLRPYPSKPSQTDHQEGQAAVQAQLFGVGKEAQTALSLQEGPLVARQPQSGQMRSALAPQSGLVVDVLYVRLHRAESLPLAGPMGRGSRCSVSCGGGAGRCASRWCA